MQILMATKNGGPFLLQQLESFVSQENVEFSLTVLDSNSDDETWKILKEFSARIEMSLYSDNLASSTESFLRLIEMADPNNPVMFSDQDDIWYPNKIDSAMQIEKLNSPIILTCNRDILFERNNQIRLNTRKIPRVTWKSAVAENLAYGNTIAINSAGVKLLKKINFANLSIEHYDFFLYQLFALYGDVKFDNVPKVLYRIHEKNQIGLGNRFDFLQKRTNVKKSLESFKAIIDLELTPSDPITKLQAVDFLKRVGSKQFSSRITAVMTHPGERSKKFETLVWNIAAVFCGFRY
jgi:glycosyltransferase involved in cell wall biosynthesis